MAEPGELFDEMLQDALDAIEHFWGKDSLHQVAQFMFEKNRARGGGLTRPPQLSTVLRTHAESMWSEGWYTVSNRMVEAASSLTSKEPR
jgi:hypothetical protein